MTDIAIRVENLSKQYRIGGPQARYKTIRESLTEAVQNRDKEMGRQGARRGFLLGTPSPPLLVSISRIVRLRLTNVTEPTEGAPGRDFVVSSVERSTGGWAPCWMRRLERGRDVRCRKVGAGREATPN